MGEHEEASQCFEILLAFNDNTVERRRFFQLTSILLSIEIDEEERGLEFDNYEEALIKMYGHDLYQNALGSVNREVRFVGLPVTNLSMHGLEKHQRLLESYEKLRQARKKFRSQ